ncbi:MAG: LmeA family phospholipid-binding protein [Thermocrispum sp.]
MTRTVRRGAQQGPRTRRRKPRRRGLKIVIVLLVLLGILIGVDFGLAAFAEHTVSQKAREKFRLTDDPAVTIHGFPFATQAIGGEYDHITVEAQGVNVKDTLRDLELVAELRNVQAPLSDLIDGNTDSMVIGDLEGIVKIKQSDVGRLVRLPNLSIEPAGQRYVETGDEEDKISIEDLGEQREEMDAFPATAGIRLAATTRISGRETEIVVFGIIELNSTAVRIRPERLEFRQNDEVIEIPDQLRELWLPRFDRTISPGSLPFGVRPSGVAVEQGALLVQGKARNVRFDQQEIG